MQALNPDGKLQTLRCDADGKLAVTGVAGGGGGAHRIAIERFAAHLIGGAYAG